MPPKPLLLARGLTKTYHRGADQVHAVDGVSLEIQAGEFVSFMGPSGSGKTTLLNLLGCLENPSSGELQVDRENIFAEGLKRSETDLTRLRRRSFGYIFQTFYLLPALTVYENVILPWAFYRKDGVARKVPELLQELGLDHRQHHLPSQLSGGEMQRVAIARSLLNEPKILLADEPTGSLDSKRGGEIGQLLLDLNQKQGITIIMVTHNPELAGLASRTLRLKDGRIET